MFIELKANKSNPSKPYRVGLKNRQDEFTSTSQEPFTNAGWVLGVNEVVVDIDNHGKSGDLDKEQMLRVLDYFDIKTKTVHTNSGLHLYFKFDGKKLPRDAVCNLGFTVEYKKDWVITKVNGVSRETKNENVLAELPNIFKPNKKLPNLVGLEDGDGRHNNMVKLWSSTQSQQICKFVNNHIFAEPIPDDKLLGIFTIEPEPELSTRELALEFIDSKNLVKFMGEVYAPKGGRWINNEESVKGLISEKYESFGFNKINEIYQFCKIILDNEQQSKFQKVKFGNGYVHKGRFVNIDYKEFTPFTIDRVYNPEAKCNKALQTLLNMLFQNDEEVGKYFFTLLGSGLCLDVSKRLKNSVFHVFFGTGGDGKTILFDLLQEAIGLENVSVTKLHDLNNPKELTSMADKLYNLGDDIEKRAIDQTVMSLLKNISSLNRINVNPLYKSAKPVRITTQMLFTSNNLVKSFEKGDSIERRAVFVNFSTNLLKLSKSGKVGDEFFQDLRSEENLDYLIKRIVEGYIDWYQFGLPKCKKVEEFTKKWCELNDFTKKYIVDKGIEYFEYQNIKDVYFEYQTFCDEEDLEPRKKKTFREEIEVLLNMEHKQCKKDGSNIRLFVNKEVNDG